jgi:hypothetical protein
MQEPRAKKQDVAGQAKYDGNTIEINRALRGGQAKYNRNKPSKPVCGRYFHRISIVFPMSYFTERSAVYFHRISIIFPFNYFSLPAAAGISQSKSLTLPHV